MSKASVDYISKIVVPDVYTKIRALEIRIEQLQKQIEIPRETYCLESW